MVGRRGLQKLIRYFLTKGSFNQTPVSSLKITSIAEEPKEVEDEDEEYRRKRVMALKQMYESKAEENEASGR